jgi:hypothetical protein
MKLRIIASEQISAVTTLALEPANYKTAGEFASKILADAQPPL